MSKVNFKFDLGTIVTDTITGLVGKITFQTRWLTGCNTYNVQPPIDKYGKVPEVRYVHENVLEKVKEEKPPKSNRKLGGPRDSAPRQSGR